MLKVEYHWYTSCGYRFGSITFDGKRLVFQDSLSNKSRVMDIEYPDQVFDMISRILNGLKYPTILSWEER